ncbi:hypothetical protein B0H16DRAFT_1728912 [Mycena metata]|uniref:F-box domain-containing protein n=1 Tax=Mycena metata TaxID=1033252 RepID=A0AAD7IFD3_9AGAR|nr:hypothetical protein B0H16DRAFT_1728912 [Mycena metata]
MPSSFGVLAALSFAFPVLPPEILGYIFRLVCSEHDPTLRQFRAACIRLSHVNRYWRAVACAEPSLWRTLVVDDTTPPGYLDAFIEYSGHRPIAVAFALIRVFSPASRSPYCAPLVASAIRILSSLHRWEALELYIDHRDTMDALVSLFTDLRAPRLRYVSLTCREFSLTPTPTSHASPTSLFGPTLHSIRHITLDGVMLPPALASPMPLLVDLALDGIPSPFWPTYHAFIRLVAQSPSLRRICLNCVGFTGAPPVSSTLVSHILHFDISFGFGTLECGRSTLVLLASLVFSDLDSLRMAFRNTRAAAAFAATSIVFNARRVCLEGPCTDILVVRSIMARLHHVAALDLCHGHSAMLAALKPAHTVDSAIPLPSVASLRLYEPDWVALLDALASRASASQTGIKELQCCIPRVRSYLKCTVPHVSYSDFPAFQQVLCLVDTFAWFEPTLPDNPLLISKYFT